MSVMSNMSTMSNDIMTDLLKIEERIDSVITFALIRFVHEIGRSVLSEVDLALASGILLVVLGVLPRVAHVQQIVKLCRQIVVMVFSQSAINIVTQNQLVINLNLPRFDILMQAFTVTTCMLVLMSLLAYSFRDVDAVRRSMTLLLYIYADATEFIVNTLDLGGMLASTLAIFVYLVFRGYKSQLAGNFTLLYIMRAFNMVCINLILQSIVDVDANYVGVQFQSAVLIIVLFFIDALSVVMPALNEARDYAVWKSSQKLFYVVQTLQVDTEVLLFACFFVICSKPLWHTMLTSVYELALLVVINVLLELASNYIDRAHSVDKAILLFIYVIVIHEASGLVFSERKRGKVSK